MGQVAIIPVYTREFYGARHHIKVLQTSEKLLALSLTFRVNRMHHLGLKMKASRSFVDARQRTQSNLQKQVGE